MPKKIYVNVFDLSFDKLNDLTNLLKYKGQLSLNQVIRQYGTLENMVKTRLRVDTDEQAKAKLLELLGQKDQPSSKQPKELSELSTLSNEQQCAKKYAQALLNKGDEQILNSLLLAFGCSRDDVLKYFDEIKKGV